MRGLYLKGEMETLGDIGWYVVPEVVVSEQINAEESIDILERNLGDRRR